MELNSDCCDKNTGQNNKHKKYLLVKLPANIINPSKALEILGGKEKILSKHLKDEDLDFSYFNKKIPLEKCISTDFLIKRKRLRKKNNPNEIRYKYEILGKVDSIYDYFALHDFICEKPDKDKYSYDVLESK